jgi:threonine dehydrogenase-like Zn-dependent dehydrogenase
MKKDRMKAVVVSPLVKNSARIQEVVTPKPSDDEVLVKVISVGVDGTDFEINQGLYGLAPQGDDFLVIGHESFGEVREVGSKVNGFRPGDYVVAIVRRPCPENCSNCAQDQMDMCSTGHYRERGIKGLHGFLSEYYVEQPRFLVKVPDSLKDIAVILEPLSIVEKAITEVYRFQERLIWEPRTALVLGAGAIGLLATFVLSLKGVSIWCLARGSPNDIQQEIFSKLGVRYVNTEDNTIHDLQSKGRRFDIIIEATGFSPLAFDALEVLKTNGIMCRTGISGGDRVINIHADKINLEMVLGNKVVFGSVNANRSHFEQGLRDLEVFEKRWPGLLKKLITRRVNFLEFKEALEKKATDIKVIVELI